MTIVCNKFTCYFVHLILHDFHNQRSQIIVLLKKQKKKKGSAKVANQKKAFSNIHLFAYV